MNDKKDRLVVGMAVTLALIFLIYILWAHLAYGTQPYVDHEEILHQRTVYWIIKLESGQRNIPCNYSETCNEYGPAQFKEETFNWMKSLAKMEQLEWRNPTDQVTLLDWALRNGYGNHWATYSLARQRAITEKYVEVR